MRRRMLRFSRVLLGALAVTLFAFILATAAAAATPVVNGDFESGDLTGWTTFTTANGTLGTPGVVSFDTTGSGASNASQFNVGEIDYTGVYEGGGIYQTVNIEGQGLFSVSADIAATNLRPFALGSNASCGLFELLIDDRVVASHDFGDCDGGSTVRSTLSATGVSLSPGSHDIRIRITRPFISHPGPDDTTGTRTPFEYVDNISLTVVPPTTKDQCMKGGWETFGIFKNLGDCVSFVATEGGNPPTGLSGSR